MRWIAIATRLVLIETMSKRFFAVRPSITLLISMVGAPTASAVAPTKFAAVGDVGNTSNSAAVAKLMRDQGAQFILMLGDLCYGSQPLATQINANYRTEKAEGKLWPALGNHEFKDACGGGGAASGYRNYFSLPNNERYYEFERGPVHFFVLNSHQDPDGVSATSKQAMWLRDKLAASKSPWQVVFFHHPPYSSGTHGSSVHMRWPFESWGVDAVLSGHDHDYERFMIDADGNGVKMPYFVSGLGGRSRRSFVRNAAGSVKQYNSAFGALFVTATSTSLNFEFRSDSSGIIDRYAMTQKNAVKPSSVIKREPRPTSSRVR